MRKSLLLLIIIFSFVFAQHIPTEERGNPDYRRYSNIEANQVKTSIFNFGITGRQSVGVPDYFPYEWPKNSQHHYLAMTVLTVGSLLETEEGIKLPLVTITGRNSPSGKSKNWEPVPEYLNSNSANIAMSDDFTTWPEYWNNKSNDPDDPGRFFIYSVTFH